MRNLKTAAKIGVGFGLVIAIAMAIGAIAIWNMLGVQGDARRLDRETVPQVELANNIERSAELAMYNMHGYALTAQNLYLMKANGFLDQTRSHLAEAEELAARSPRLNVLRKNTAEAIARVEDYKKLSADLQAANNDLLSARMALDSSSSSFMEKALKFLDSQNQQVTAAVRAGAGSGGIERWMARINGISGIILLVNNLNAAAYKAQALGDASTLKRAIDDFAVIDDKMKALSAVTLAGDRPALEQIQLDAEAHLAACNLVLADMTKVGDLTSMSAGAADVLLAKAGQTSVEGFKDAHAFTALAVTRMVTSIFSLLAGLVAAAFIGVGIAIAISRAITRPLAKAVAFAQRVAGGDFTQQLPIHQRDEVGILAEALNGMAQKLRETVASVQQDAGQVASSSEQISASAQKLSEGAQSQASTLEETSASMEQLTASVDQISQHAQSQSAAMERGASSMALVQSSIEAVSGNLTEISDLTQRSVENALQGAKAVDSVVDGITRIAQSSEKIGGIVDVISDIADQTNLLALNAAIEAARAGEHGRGFAVVAEEVSKLADRSASSTKEIGALIKESVKNVTEGVKIAMGSQFAMEQIRAASQRVNEMIAELAGAVGQQVTAVKELSASLASVSEMSHNISAATEEQTSTARQVSKAMEDVNELAQSAAASAEQMSAATVELTTMAQELHKVVGTFRIVEEEQAAAAVTAAIPILP